MQPLREAIKKKYGVSDEESDQVIKALTEIERVRQDAAGPQVQSFRARQPGDKTNAKEVPDIGTIIGQATNTRSTRSGQTGSGGVAGMGFVGVIISIFMTILKVFLGSRQKQGAQSGGGGGAVTSVLTDLLGGASNPTQAPDLGSIIGGLLQSNSGGASGGQTPDIQDMVQVLMNQNQSSSSSPTGNPGLTRPKAR